MARGCSGKLRYDTRASATKALRNFLRRVGGDKTTVYHCGHCDGFHVGRDPKRSGVKDRVNLDARAKVRRYWQLVRGEAL